MKLVPMRLPGRSTRMARAFATAIWQLRAQGYTFEAIREALAGAGIHVSNSTVQREVAKYTELKSSAVPAATGDPDDRPMPLSLAPTALDAPAAVQGTSARADLRSGKEVAEAFMRNRITNPLIRSKEQR